MPQILLHQWHMSPFCNKTRRCLSYKGLVPRALALPHLKAWLGRCDHTAPD